MQPDNTGSGNNNLFKHRYYGTIAIAGQHKKAPLKLSEALTIKLF